MSNKERFFNLVSWDIQTNTIERIRERQKKRKFNMIWEYIKADSFFRDYLPHIKSYKHKIRGKNGRGNQIKFSEVENKEIKAALKRLFKDLCA